MCGSASSVSRRTRDLCFSLIGWMVIVFPGRPTMPCYKTTQSDIVDSRYKSIISTDETKKNAGLVYLQRQFREKTRTTCCPRNIKKFATNVNLKYKPYPWGWTLTRAERILVY